MTRQEISQRIPVKLGPPHAGLIVLFTREEWSRLWDGVDPEVCAQLERDVLGIEEKDEPS